jgi:hypothetical protein
MKSNPLTDQEELLNAFFLTYPTFTTNMELIRAFIVRWNTSVPQGLVTEEEINIWKVKTQRTIQQR